MSEKKVYAMAPHNGACAGLVKPGMAVEVLRDDRGFFDFLFPEFVGESDVHTGNWEKSSHLNGGNWTRLELTEEEAEAINAKLTDPLHTHPQSELDADQYTAGADELQYDPDEVAFDSVNAPSHYTSGDIECIDAIRAQMTPEQFAGYLRGNLVKYVWRYEHKGGVESLRKAEWYLRRLIDVVE